MARGPGKNLGDDQDYAGLSDEELARAVREHLEADQTVDAHQIEVGVDEGRVRLAGRVGSEVERETAERVVTDVIGLEVAANELRVEQTLREGARAAEVPTPEVAYGEPREVGAEGSGEQVTGTGVTESEPALGEVIGTEDAKEASDEGRSWTPPDEPWPEAQAATDPPHGVAADRPRPEPKGRRRGRRPPRAEEAIARAVREASSAGQAAADNATSFKEQMRDRAGRRNRAKDEES